MRIDRQEFLHVLAVDAAAGMGVDSKPALSAPLPEHLYDLPRFGNVHLLHRAGLSSGTCLHRARCGGGLAAPATDRFRTAPRYAAPDRRTGGPGRAGLTQRPNLLPAGILEFAERMQ